MSVKNGAVPNEENKTVFTSLPVYFPDANEKLITYEFLDASSGVVFIVGKCKILYLYIYIFFNIYFN